MLALDWREEDLELPLFLRKEAAGEGVGRPLWGDGDGDGVRELIDSRDAERTLPDSLECKGDVANSCELSKMALIRASSEAGEALDAGGSSSRLFASHLAAPGQQRLRRTQKGVD